MKTKEESFVRNGVNVVEDGHIYDLLPLEAGGDVQRIKFIKKTRLSDGELATTVNGTTNEQVLQMMIDRMEYLNNKLYCFENTICIGHLKAALSALQERTKERTRRGVDGTHLR